MKKQRIAAALGALLIIAGYTHLSAEAFLDMDMDRVRQYILHVIAGLFFGWAYWKGFLAVSDAAVRSLVPALTSVAFASPILFLLVIHQTKHEINDGPATIAMGAALVISALAGMVANRRE